ncbi:MAG: PTS sugar transporter subunit IIA [Planctomycetes bacterium]|nr:PTS sugar transporter subunit IIA [Planctomycetota bacterium]
MNLTKILEQKNIKVGFENSDKEAVIKELIDLLESNGSLSNCEEVLEVVLIREKTRSTGIGSGIAIPHGKCGSVKELIMAIGVSSEPIEFESVDGKGVSIVLLLLSPADQTGPHIQALASISRLMLDEEFRMSLVNADSAEHVYELISKKEA